MMADWYAVQVRPSLEAVAAASLERAGYEAFCPMGSIRSRPVVLFPGYLFVCDPLSMGLSRVPWAWAVIRLLGGAVPVPIPGEVIDLLSSDMAKNGGSIPLSTAGFPMRALAPGEFVRIIGGILEDVQGTVRGVDGGRVSIILDGSMGAVVHAALEEVRVIA